MYIETLKSMDQNKVYIFGQGIRSSPSTPRRNEEDIQDVGIMLYNLIFVLSHRQLPLTERQFQVKKNSHSK